MKEWRKTAYSNLEADTFSRYAELPRRTPTVDRFYAGSGTESLEGGAFETITTTTDPPLPIGKVSHICAGSGTMHES